jgi:acetamidase/formamidase
MDRLASRVIHEIPLERRTLHGHFSRDLPPILTVDPGDSLRFPTLDAGWHAAPENQFFDDLDPELDGGHALVGPIEVRGARAGGTLEVRIDAVDVGTWGITFGDGKGMLWTLDARAGTGFGPAGATVDLSPFLGVLGMPPPEPGVHSTAPPRRWGGNIDCKELIPGTTLFLPIPVDGAHFSAGDGHARQGDGEVSGTAIECPLERAELTLDLRGDRPLETPVAHTPEAWIAFGFDEDLDEAAGIATEAMLDLMGRELNLDRSEALALASVAVDLRVTQVVNGAKGIHAVLAHDAIRMNRTPEPD